jgi:hypothetical protein
MLCGVIGLQFALQVQALRIILAAMLLAPTLMTKA